MKTLLSLLFVFTLAAPLHAQSYLRGATRVGISGGANVGGEEATAKYADYTPHPYGTLSFEYFVAHHIALSASLMAGTLEAEIVGRAQFPAYGDQLITGYDAKYYGLSAGAQFNLPVVFQLTPFVRPRLGILAHQTRVDGDRGFEKRISGSALTYGLGVGIEYPLARNIDFAFGYDLVLTSSDDLDGLRSGDKNDALSVFTLGLNILITPGGAAAPRRPADERFGSPGPTSRPTAERLPRQTATQDSTTRSRLSDSGPGDKIGNADPKSGKGNEPSAPVDGLEAQPLRGIVIEQQATVPREEQLRGIERGGSLKLFTQLRVAPLHRLSELEEDPSLFTLHAVQTGDARMQLRCSVEMLRDGVPFYQGNADLVLDGRETAFDAEDLFDMTSLLGRNDGHAALPRGNYLVRISTVAWDHDLSSLAKAKFLNVDLRPIFGAKEEDAREVITERAVDVGLEGGQQLLVNFFRATERAAERDQLEKTTPERLRAPLRLAPTSLTGQPREQYLAEAVEQSLNDGLTLQSYAGSIGNAQNLKIVLSEIFFPIDSDMLGEESRIVLDNVARVLNQHPELFAEIRGYASDVGDESSNRLLAERRAQRALEYLVRQKLNTYRATAAAGAQQPVTAGEDARTGRKVEIVLRNRGM